MGHATALDKYGALVSYAKDYGLRTLVETGLYVGGGTGGQIWNDHGAELLDRYIVIDVQPSNCRLGAANYPGAEVYCGDSGDVLPLLLAAGRIDTPCLFWLDAHGIPDELDTIADFPTIKEVEAIAAWPHGAQSVLLVDDMDMMDGSSLVGPLAQQFRDAVATAGGELWERSEPDSIMRLVPKLV
jgi:hypothetical protein